MMKILLFWLFFFCAIYSPAQKRININNLRTKFVTTESILKRDKQFSQKITELIDADLNYVPEDQIRDILSEIDTRIARDSGTVALLNKLIDRFHNFSFKTRRMLITTYTSILPENSKTIERIFHTASNVKIFSIAAVSLKRSGTLTSSEILDQLELKFSKTKEKLFFNSIKKFLKNETSDNLPPLEDLLKAKFQEGKIIIYSFFRKNRSIPGISILRLPNGEFFKNEDGSIFSIPQLALSENGLPWFFPDGNTPQGIYSIVGWYITPTESIGPTPNVLTRMPFEVSPSTFFHGKNPSQAWDVGSYLELLPKSWRNYEPILQSYFAGKLGRKLIIMHGSTDDPKYYAEQTYSPLTPSKGCITSTEIWEQSTGKCVKSDQAELMNAYFAANERKGFLIVLELDDGNSPVTVDEIQWYIRKFSN